MWPKPPLINYTDIREAMSFFRLIFRFSVCMPYKIVKTKDGIIFKAQKPGLYKIIEMTIQYVVIYYAQIMRYSYIDPNDFVSYNGIITQYNVLSFVACASTFSFLITHKHYVNSMNSIAEIDKKFKLLDINMTYNYWLLLYCSYASNLVFVPIMLNATERDWIKTILDLIAFHQPVIIRFAAMSKPVMGMGIIYEHFVKLNAKLSELLNLDESQISMKFHVEFLLDFLTNIHADLIDATNELNKGFTFMILLNAVSNITQVVLALLFIYARNYKEISPLELTVSFTLYTLQMGALYLIGHLIKEEAKKTLILLGHFNIYYMDKNLCVKKNTFLLQGKHHKLDLRVCSVIPLNLNIFLKQISICSTLFLILLQFYIKSQSK